MMAQGWHGQFSKQRFFSNASLSRRASSMPLGCRLPRRERVSVSPFRLTALLRRLCGVMARVSLLDNVEKAIGGWALVVGGA
ncbi:MAG: hypothetical protein J6T13_02140 [Bacteroidales bacterium]|nr:hypothetical protein [Bacteroidales bacterium]